MQSLLGWESIRRQRASIAGRDVLIDPDIEGLSVTGFNNYELGIERGRAAAQKAGDRLAGLSVSDAQWAAYLAERKARTNPAPIRIESVRIVNTSNVPDEIVAPLITTRPGDNLDGAIMARDVARVFALDEFDRVDYSIDVAPGANSLVVNAKGGRASDKYFMAGMVLGSNFGKSSTFELAVSFTDRNFLGTGAEWRGYGRVGNDILFDVSLFKQFGRFQQNGRVFVEPVAYFQKFSALVTQQGSSDSVSALQSLSAGAGVDGGVIFGNWLELRGGVRIGGVNPSDAGGNTGLPPGWNREVDWRVGATIDTLDSVTFPREGNLVQLQYIDRVSALGGEFRRNTLTANLLKPFTWDRTTLLVGGRLGTTWNAINSNLGDYQLGGFLNLSGLQRNSLIGQQLLFGRVVGYHRIGEKSPIFDLPIYLGGSLEAGNVWTSTSDISLGNLRTSASAFIAADTPIGPAWFAIGQSGSNTSIYLVLGRLF
jgi:NTE family protein